MYVIYRKYNALVLKIENNLSNQQILEHKDGYIRQKYKISRGVSSIIYWRIINLSSLIIEIDTIMRIFEILKLDKHLIRIEKVLLNQWFTSV